MRVFLVGYMGVGKTTIGKKISARLGLKFIDLDRYISAKENLSVVQIIENKGEDYFRSLEKKRLNEVTQLADVLVATGGGTPCYFDNMEVINSNGTSVYLELDEKTLLKRLSHNLDSRPLLKGKSLDELAVFVSKHLNSRKSFYEKANLIFNALSFDADRLDTLVRKLKL